MAYVSRVPCSAWFEVPLLTSTCVKRVDCRRGWSGPRLWAGARAGRFSAASMSTSQSSMASGDNPLFQGGGSHPPSHPTLLRLARRVSPGVYMCASPRPCRLMPSHAGGTNHDAWPPHSWCCSYRAVRFTADLDNSEVTRTESYAVGTWPIHSSSQRDGAAAGRVRDTELIYGVRSCRQQGSAGSRQPTCTITRWNSSQKSKAQVAAVTSTTEKVLCSYAYGRMY